MDSSIYIPKWLIAAFLAAVGCAAGWMFGAADLVTASLGSPGPAADSAPPAAHDAEAAQAAPAAARNTGGSDQAAPAAATAARPAPEPALQGAASTVNSTVRITSAADDHRGEAMTPNSTVRIVSTPDGNQGEAATPNSNVRIDAVVSESNGAGSPASTPAASTPASTTARPSPTGGPAQPANSGVVTAPMGARIAAPAAPPVTAPPQIATPRSSPVTGLGSWGPPQPLPPLVPPPFFAENLWNPLPGAQSRGVAFSEWESYRTDVAGRNILVTTDDSNFFRDRNGKINGNTGDVDASGLNVVGAVDSFIRGSESADEAPWQTMAAALVDLAGGGNGTTPPPPGNGTPPPPGNGNGDEADDDEDVDEFQEADEPNGDVAPGTPTQPGTQPTQGSHPTTPAPTPTPTPPVTPPPSNGGDGFDFPYESWVENATADHATAVHTDEGTTLASGSDAIVIGADGYDDDDNRAVGENIAITRDDGNVVIGGTGDVNAQIGDAEQGAVVMDVNRTFIQGGGAY
jgi:hypothetical protein